jgi:hypothetical protein
MQSCISWPRWIFPWCQPAPCERILHIRLQRHLLDPLPQVKILHDGRDCQGSYDILNPSIPWQCCLHCPTSSTMLIHHLDKVRSLIRNTLPIQPRIRLEKSGRAIAHCAANWGKKECSGRCIFRGTQRLDSPFNYLTCPLLPKPS